LIDECLLVCCPKSNAAIIYQSELIYTDEVTPSWHELHLVAGHRDIHPFGGRQSWILKKPEKSWI
jgi:hypothetical protein